MPIMPITPNVRSVHRLFAGEKSQHSRRSILSKTTERSSAGHRSATRFGLMVFPLYVRLNISHGKLPTDDNGKLIANC